MKITLLERIGLVFIASLMSSILYLYNIMDYEIAYAICAALGFIALVVRLYYKSCFPEVSILKIVFTLTVKLFLGTIITALLLICIQAVIKIDIYNYIKEKPYMEVIFIVAVTSLIAYIKSSFSKDANKKLIKELIKNVGGGLATAFLVPMLINHFFKYPILQNLNISMSVFIAYWQVEIIERTNDQKKGNNSSIKDFIILMVKSPDMTEEEFKEKLDDFFD